MDIGTSLPVLARVVLAVAFLIAAGAKLADLPGTRRSMEDFGAGRLAPVGAILIPLAELAIAGGLIDGGTATASAAGAFALLILFSLAIALNLARGRRPECRCFAAIAAKPIGLGTLVRNAALITLAALVVIAEDPGAGLLGWLGGLEARDAAVLAVGLGILLALALACGLLVQVLAQQGRILGALEGEGRGGGRSEGLPVGVAAPPFDLEDADGARVSLSDATAGASATVLLFLEPGCGACQFLLPDLDPWRRALPSEAAAWVVLRGSPSSLDGSPYAGLREIPILFEQGGVSMAYRVSGTPSAVVIGENGQIATPLATGQEAVRALLADVASRTRSPDAERAAHGTRDSAPLPDLELESVGGGQVRLSALSPQERLLLFWDPHCPYCQRLADEVREQWSNGHAQRELVVISRRSPEEVEAMGLPGLVLLDTPTLEAAQALGVRGTPSAIRVDARGRVLGETARGLEGVHAAIRDAAPAANGSRTAIGS